MATKKIKIPVQIDTKQAQQGVNDLTDSVKGLNQETAQSKDNIQDTSQEFGNFTDKADQATGGLISKFRGFKGALKSVATGFKGIGGAIAASGLGLLVLIVSSVTAAFKNSEAGQNKFARLMGVIGSITGNLIDVLAKIGDFIISAFENPKKAISDFVTLLKEQVVNRFTGLLELIPALGRAIGLLFSGKWKEAAKVAADATLKVTTGIENMTDKIAAATEATKEFIAELEREARIAADIADKRAKADKVERDLLVERAEANKDRAELLDKAEQKALFSLNERIDFLQEAAQIEEEITNKEIEAAQLLFDAKVAENALSGSTKEDLREEAQLKADLINLETSRIKANKTITTKVVALRREESAATQKLIDDATKARELAEETRLKEEEERIAKEKELAEERLETARELEDLRLDALEDGVEKELNINNTKYSRLIEDINSNESLSLEDRKSYILLYEDALEDSNDRIMLADAAKIQALADADKKAKEDKEAADKEAADKEIEEAKRVQAAKIQGISAGFGAIADISLAASEGQSRLAKRAFQINKIANIAKTTIDTYSSAVASYNALAGIPVVGPVVGALAAAAAVTAGLIQVNNIRKTQFTSATGPGAGSGLGNINTNISPTPVPNSLTLNRNITDDDLNGGAGSRQEIIVHISESEISNKKKTLDSFRNRSKIG